MKVNIIISSRFFMNSEWFKFIWFRIIVIDYSIGFLIISFIGKMEKLINPNYIPSVDDVLFLRQRTIGIRNYVFDINSGTKQKKGISKPNIEKKLSVYDVGGERNKRSNWWQPFFHAQVTRIIYVSSLVGFDKSIDRLDLEEGTIFTQLDDSIDTFIKSKIS